MANFLFYRYHFENTGLRSLFSPEAGENVSEKTLNDDLIKDLKGIWDNTRVLQLTGYKYDRKGEQTPEIYANEVERFDNGIVQILVKNNKVKHYIPLNSNEKKDVDHHPFCWVIIDTRPGSQVILVQQKREAFANPNDVAVLIENYCNSRISYLGWEMVIEKRLCKGDIWDIVRMRTEGGQDSVKSLGVIIQKKQANEENKVDKALQFVMDQFAVSDGELKLFADGQTRKLLDETKADARNIVNMLIKNQYKMKIGFDNSGTYEYGRRADAVYGREDKVFENYRDGVMSFGDNGNGEYALVKWLDVIIPENNKHEYSQSDKKGKNGKRKKK